MYLTWCCCTGCTASFSSLTGRTVHSLCIQMLTWSSQFRLCTHFRIVHAAAETVQREKRRNKAKESKAAQSMRAAVPHAQENGWQSLNHTRHEAQSATARHTTLLGAWSQTDMWARHAWAAQDTAAEAVDIWAGRPARLHRRCVRLSQHTQQVAPAAFVAETASRTAISTACLSDAP